jgi:hypothetical protein
MSFDIAKRRLISQALIGSCPKCHSSNTHDCEAPDLAPTDPRAGLPYQYFSTGSSCKIVQEIGDPTVAHCDDCGYLWCLQCDEPLEMDKENLRGLIAEHLAECGGKGIVQLTKVDNFPSTCMICGANASPVYVIEPKGDQVSVKLCEIMKKSDEFSFTGAAICSSCLDGFMGAVTKVGLTVEQI